MKQKSDQILEDFSHQQLELYFLPVVFDICQKAMDILLGIFYFPPEPTPHVEDLSSPAVVAQQSESVLPRWSSPNLDEAIGYKRTWEGPSLSEITAQKENTGRPSRSHETMVF